MLSVHAVGKSSDTIRAVDKVSFDVHPGEIFGLIGPNGAGKSTTIRMVMNIIAPDEGFIRFDGVPFTEKLKARIGYLPEERGLNPRVRVDALLYYFAALKGIAGDVARVSADLWLERFGLMDWKRRKVGEHYVRVTGICSNRRYLQP